MRQGEEKITPIKYLSVPNSSSLTRLDLFSVANLSRKWGSSNSIQTILALLILTVVAIGILSACVSLIDRTAVSSTTIKATTPVVLSVSATPTSRPTLTNTPASFAISSPTPIPSFTPTSALIDIEPIDHIGGYIWTVYTENVITRPYIYVGIGPELTILDVTNPNLPGRVGAITLPHTIQDMEVRDNYVYLAVGEAGLWIVDISNPTTPVKVGFHNRDSKYGTKGRVQSVTVRGNYAYLGANGNEVRVLNISDPTKPAEIGFYKPEYGSNEDNTWLYGISDITVIGNYAYVVGGDLTEKRNGLRILDISDPTDPIQIGSYNTLREATRVVVVNEYAYILVPKNRALINDATDGALHIVDVSNPATPKQVGFYETLALAWDITVRDNYAYVVDETAGLRIVDVSNPATPSEVGFFDPSESILSVAVNENYAYIGGENGLQVVDISERTAPVETGHYLVPGLVKDVVILGKYAYLATGGQGLAVVDVSNPIDPTLIALYQTPGYALSVAAAGNYVYIGAELAGLRIIDVSNPATPIEVGVYDPLSEVHRVIIFNSYAYITGNGDLRIIDVSDPTNPTEIGHYASPGWVEQVIIAGEYAYVSEDKGLRILDISNPTQLNEKGFYVTPGATTNITVIGQDNIRYAYIGWVEYPSAYYCIPGMHLVDVSNPTKPTLVSDFYEQEKYIPTFVNLNNTPFTYLINEGRLYRVDTLDPATPIETGFYQTAYDDMTVAGNYLYVPAASEGLFIFQPTWINTLLPLTPTLTPEPAITPLLMTTLTSTLLTTPSFQPVNTSSPPGTPTLNRITPSAQSSIPAMTSTTNLEPIVSPFSPNQIIDFIEAKKSNALDEIWAGLNLKPTFFNQDIYVKRYDVEGDSTISPDVILRIVAQDLGHYLLFDRQENKWELRGYATDIYSRFGEFSHRLISNSDQESWLVIRRHSGSGTGYSFQQEDWYQLGDRELKLVLSYPAEGYVSGPSPFNTKFESEVFTYERDDNRFLVEVQIEFEYESGYWDDEELAYLKLFTTERKIYYIWESNVNKFIIDTAHSELSQKELGNIFPHPQEFLKHNFEELIQLAKTGNELQQKWLKRFLNERSSRAQDSIEVRTLLEIME